MSTRRAILICLSFHHPQPLGAGSFDNDAIGNVAVLLAASGVWATATAWPDLIVAGIMAGLFLWSSAQIVRQALAELRSTQTLPLAAE